MDKLAVLIIIALIAIGCKSSSLSTIKENRIHDKVEITDVITAMGVNVSIDKDVVLDFIYIARDSSIVRGTVKDKSMVIYRDTTRQSVTTVVEGKEDVYKEVVVQEEKNTKTKVEQWTSLVWAVVFVVVVMLFIGFYRKYVK